MIYERDNRYLSFIITSVVFCLFLTNASYLLQAKTGISYSIVSTGCKGIIAFFIIMALGALYRRFNKSMLLMVAAIFFVAFVQELFFKNNLNFSSTFQTFLFNAMPCFFAICAMSDFEILYFQLKKTSYIISGITFVLLISNLLSTFEGNYAMGFSNALVLPSNILVLELIHTEGSIKKKAITGCLLVANVVTLFICGSRGSFISIVALFVFLQFRLFLQERRSGNLIAVAVIIMAFLLYKPLLSGINSYLVNSGFRSRTLSLLINDATHDSGRNELWASVIQALRDNPFAIRGINGDYSVAGWYVHNYFLELLCDWGVLIGGFLCIYICVNIVRTMRENIHNNHSKFIVVLMFSFFPMCLWSGSIWHGHYFWAWFGYVVSRRNKLSMSVEEDTKGELEYERKG